MRKTVFYGLLAATLVVGLVLAGCQTEPDTPIVETFNGVGATGEEFVLTITDGSAFVFVIDGNTVSGTAQFVNGIWVLTITSGGSGTLEVGVDGSGGITDIDGNATVEGGNDIDGPVVVAPPPTLPPGTGNDPFSGTWEALVADPPPDAHRIVASNGSFSQYVVSEVPPRGEFIRGTYTVSGNTVTITIIEVDMSVMGGGGDANWVAWAGLVEELKDWFGGSQTTSVTISGNEFTIPFAGGMTFTRQSP